MLPTLKRSADRKVTNGVSPNGKTAKIANSFGLLSGRGFSCPGATSVCERVCYAGKLERLFPGTRANLTHNWESVRDASETDLVDMLANMLNAFGVDCAKEDVRRAKRNLPPVPRDFRIHWDGDLFSARYTRAWATVIAAYPEVRFWIYTRSFDYVSLLADLPNLSLYLSVDSDNRAAAIACRVANPWARVAWLDETFADGRAAIPASDVKAYACPENKGSLPLITEKGSACLRCGICPSGRGDVLFSIRKR